MRPDGSLTPRTHSGGLHADSMARCIRDNDTDLFLLQNTPVGLEGIIKGGNVEIVIICYHVVWTWLRDKCASRELSEVCRQWSKCSQSAG